MILKLFLALFFVLAPFFIEGAFSATSDELRQKIFDRGSEIEKLEEEIKKYKEELSGVQNESQSLRGVISQINTNHKKIETELKVTVTNIEKAELTIQEMELNAVEMEVTIKRKRKLLGELIRELDVQESRTLTELIFTEDNISALFDEFVAFEKIQLLLRDEVQDLRYVRQRLLLQKEEIEGEKKDLLGYRSELDDRESILERSKREKNELLAATKNVEANYKKKLADKESQMEEFEQELRNFEAELKVIIDQESFPDAGTSVLSYPLEDILVTQKFGRTVDAKRLYASGSHNGIDFRAPVGTKVFSAADGVVVGTGDTDKGGCYSYGKWILIEHDNGLSTLYAHLDVLKVEEGREVKRGGLIGYSGKTGYATGPHLHFGVYVSQAVEVMKYDHSRFCKHVSIPIAPIEAYLDPEAYF